MPEYSNIQSFEVVTEQNFKNSLSKFRRVLEELEIWNTQLEESFKNFIWASEDNGFIYPTIDCDDLIYEGIPLRVSVFIYTKEIDSTFEENWITIQLLIPTHNIRTNGSFNIPIETLRTICSTFTSQFNTTGTYFTDELQDGEDFDGIRTNDLTKLWYFDYAIIPKKLSSIYNKIPEKLTHSSYQNMNEYIALNQFKNFANKA